MSKRSDLPPLPVLLVIGFGVIYFLAQLALGPPPETGTPEPTAQPPATEAGPSAAEPELDPQPASRDLTVLLTGLDPAHAEGLVMLQVAEDVEADHLAWIKRLTPIGEPLVLEDLPAEELVLLLLHHEDWSTSRDPIATLAVDLRAGDASVELIVPELFDLEVHAPGVEPGTSLAMDLTAGLGWHSFGKHVAEVDPEGNARFVALPAGAYTLHSGGKQLQLELPSAPVVFE